MAKTLPPMRATGVTVTNEKADGQVHFTVHGAARDMTAVFDPHHVVGVATLMLTRAAQRMDPHIQQQMQGFAIAKIEGKKFPGTGQPYLEYRFENGLGFGSEIKPDELRRLHKELAELLAGLSDDLPLARVQ